MHITIIVSIEKENLTFEEIPLLGAICLTLGAKRMVIRWVKATRSYESKRSFNDDERYANPVASRVRLSLAYRWFLIFIGVYLGVH
ncbi:MAG: hypothetical protein PUP91_03415 [Rhizonema sp. PD37]|nr:hypothetical protein [Rhizonema sp. PD37]